MAAGDGRWVHAWRIHTPQLSETGAAVSSQEDSIAKIVMPIRQKYYLVLMATTGSNLAAMDAGIIPANTPNPIQILSPRMTIFGAI